MDVSYCRWNLHKFIVDDGTDPIPVWRKDGKMKETKVRRGCVVQQPACHVYYQWIIVGTFSPYRVTCGKRGCSRPGRRDRHLCAFLRYRGLCPGKWKKRQKFLWGLLVGILYVATLLGAALWIQKGSLPPIPYMGTASAICIGSAMLGGMLS